MSTHQEEAQAFWERTTTLYREFLTGTAVRLDDLRALPRNMSVDEVSEILWFCFGISAWRTVVQDFGLGWDAAQEGLLRRAVVLRQGN